MAQSGYDELRDQFIKEFTNIASYRHRYEVFTDFVTMVAISLSNAATFDQSREDEYLKLIKGYQAEDQKAFPVLLSLLVKMLEFEPRDVLGPVYMDLELGNSHTGQFFTPSEISELMVRLTIEKELKNLERPFLTVSEPTCGSGGMLMAVVKQMLHYGHDPSEKLWVQAIDVDRKVALMCYIQLTLWNVPAQVIVGNTLTLEVREVWYTPAHYLGFWDQKLARERGTKTKAEKTDRPLSPKGRPDISLKPEQTDFGF
jgi:type I restriction-modification system DNA methylase subunit